jgi:branched-chain amino acid transport system substrate-binding protein
VILRSDFLIGLGAVPVAATTNFPQITPSITVGVIGPFSGSAKHIADRLAAGVQAAMTDTNELAGSLGRTYVMRTFDDQNNVANGLLQASFATGDSSIVAMIGHVSSDVTLQAISTYGPAQMPLVVPYCTDDRITATQYRCIFRLQTKDSSEGQIFARTAIAQFKPKVPYVFVQDADYGADVANGFITAMAAQKITTPYQQFSYSKPNFDDVVAKALPANPDFVFLAGTVSDMGGIVGVLRAKGYTGPIGASQGFFDGATAKLGSAAEGMMISTSMPYLPLAPSTVRLRQSFETHYGAIDPLAAFGYAALQLIVSAVTRGSAISSSAGRNSVTTAIAQGVPVDTMTGSYSFNAFGDALQPQIYYYTIKSGAFSYLHQAHPSGFMIR